MEKVFFGEATEEMYKYADRHFWKNSTEYLSAKYGTLSVEYENLSSDFNTLSANYDELSVAYDEVKNRPQVEGDWGTFYIEQYDYGDGYFEIYLYKKSLELSSLSAIPSSSFSYESYLTSLIAPNVITIGEWALEEDTALKILKLPKMSKQTVLDNIHSWFGYMSYPTNLSVWTADNPDEPFIMEF